MLPEYKSRTNLGVGLGFVLQLVGRLVLAGTAAGSLLVLVGFVLFLYGCWSYAIGKGYSGFVGLLGLLSIFGLIVLVLLPDQNP